MFAHRFFGALSVMLMLGGLVPSSPATAQTIETQANGLSQQPSISGDGRYVVFATAASNLVPNDTNGLTDIVVRDRQTEVNILASVKTSGGVGTGTSEEPAISANGRYVVFDSSAEDLVATDNNDITDVFVRDLQTGTTEKASVGSTENEANSASQDAGISPDGRSTGLNGL